MSTSAEHYPRSPTSKPLVCLVISQTAGDATQNKLLFLAWSLKDITDVIVMTWSESTLAAAKARQLEVLCPSITKLNTPLSFTPLVESALSLLNRPLAPGKDSPTIGEVVVLDDLIGAVQPYDIVGVGRLQPAVIIKAINCGESSTPEDEHMELALARWTRNNNIPVIGLEVQSPAGPLQASRYLPTIWLRKRLDAHGGVLLPPAHRYYCSFGQDSYLESFLESEQEQRTQLGLHDTPFILLPFHVYYIHECMQALRWLGTQRAVLEQAGARVVVGCGEAFRREYKERDMVGDGMKRAWEALGQIDIVENISAPRLMLMANLTILPYPLSVVTDCAKKWGYEVLQWTPATNQLLIIPQYKTPHQAVRELLATPCM